MKYLILILLLIGFVSASCVNINSASLEDLDKIVWVGPATAQKIIDSRPFDSLDDLKKVSGIGDVKVADIKDEGLACVDEIFEEEQISEENVDDEIGNPDVILQKEPEIILLNNNKTKDDLIYISKNGQMVNWLPYGFALFLIFIVIVLLWERF